MKKVVRRTLWILAALAVVAGIVYSSLRPLEAEISILSPERVQISFTETGWMGYEKSYSVYSEVPGKVLELAVREGDDVLEGDLIAVINSSDYEHEIEQLRITISGYSLQKADLYEQERQRKDSLRSGREVLEGDLAALEVQQKLEETDLDYLDRLITIQKRILSNNSTVVGVTSQLVREVNDAYDDDETLASDAAATEAAYYNARAAFFSAQLQLEELEQLKEKELSREEYYQALMDAMGAQIEDIDRQLEESYISSLAGYYDTLIQAANSSIARLEQKILDNSVLAPVSGTIDMIADSVNIVDAAAPLVTIGMDPYIETFVTVRDIGCVSMGQKVELVLARRDGDLTFGGRVTWIGSKAQTRISALGVEERKIRVLITPEEKVPLGIGYDLDVRFPVFDQPDRLVAPKTAIFQIDGQDCVWKLDEETRAIIVPFVKGLETRTGYLVEEGLSPGDRIVTDANNELLKEGKRIAA